jgi:MFS transporter, DHA1 family, tetracycline resistance protein
MFNPWLNPGDRRRYDRAHAPDPTPGPVMAPRGAVMSTLGLAGLRSGLEPWSAPFALINGAAVGLVPILLPIVAVRYGVSHVGLVMGAFNLGAIAAPVVGGLADRYRAYRSLVTACAAASAVSLWLFPLVPAPLQLLLGLANGAAFAGAVTVANLLIVERYPKAQWDTRLGWLETVLSVGQGGALILAAWLSGLTARNGLLIAAVVPAAAIPLSLLLIPRMARTAPADRPATAGVETAGVETAGVETAGPATAGPAARHGAAATGGPRSGHGFASAGQVGEWGPASPSRVRPRHQRTLADLRRSAGLLRGPFGWMLAAWIPAYAGTAIVFALYPVLFSRAFGVAPRTSAVAFAVIVFLSLPLFIAAGRVSQRRGPAATLAGALAARVVLLAVLAALAAAGHVPAVLPLAAFGGVMFAWSFLSVASPGLTAQLVPGAEGDAQGALNAASGLAGLAGSVVGGLAADVWGYPAVLGIGAGGVLVGLAILAVKVLPGGSRPA